MVLKLTCMNWGFLCTSSGSEKFYTFWLIFKDEKENAYVNPSKIILWISCQLKYFLFNLSDEDINLMEIKLISIYLKNK